MGGREASVGEAGDGRIQVSHSPGGVWQHDQTLWSVRFPFLVQPQALRRGPSGAFAFRPHGLRQAWVHGDEPHHAVLSGAGGMSRDAS